MASAAGAQPPLEPPSGGGGPPLDKPVIPGVPFCTRHKTRQLDPAKNTKPDGSFYTTCSDCRNAGTTSRVGTALDTIDQTLTHSRRSDALISPSI